MKHLICFLIILTSALVCAQPKQRGVETITKYTFVGDVNGDGQPETSKTEFDQVLNDSGDRENDCGKPVCEIKVEFGEGIDPIVFEAMNVVVQKQFDVNGDNANEVLIYRWWYECCWVTMDLYSYKNSKWEIIATAKAFITGEEDDYRNRIDSEGRKYYLVGQKWNDDYSEILKDRIPVK